MIDALLEFWIVKRQMPQAMLWEIPKDRDISSELQLLIKRFFCQKFPDDACSTCDDCHWIDNNSHPDCWIVAPETAGGPIKIDRIRQLQIQSYHTSFRGRGRLIIIQPADHMNENAANALLKILEEPAMATHFILIASDVHRLPKTVKSRCVKYTFTSLVVNKNYVISPKEILDAWCDVLDMKISVCALVKVWLVHPFVEIVDALYHFIVQAIKSQANPLGNDAYLRFNHQIQSVKLFNILDKLTAIIKKTSKHISINETLALEDLLITSMVEEAL